MPGGDGTGPMWAQGRAGWGPGGWWCRGGGFGFGGHGRRSFARATGVPGWRRWAWSGEQLPPSGDAAEDERRGLEWRAEALDAELRRIRSRLGELTPEPTRDS